VGFTSVGVLEENLHDGSAVCLVVRLVTRCLLSWRTVGKRELLSPVTLVTAAIPMETMDKTIKRSILMRVKEVILTCSNERWLDFLMGS
jgi:hypothetical protein